MNGASERANDLASGPVLYMLIPWFFYTMWNEEADSEGALRNLVPKMPIHRKTLDDHKRPLRKRHLVKLTTVHDGLRFVESKNVIGRMS